MKALFWIRALAKIKTHYIDDDSEQDKDFPPKVTLMLKTYSISTL